MDFKIPKRRKGKENKVVGTASLALIHAVLYILLLSLESSSQASMADVVVIPITQSKKIASIILILI